jgi:F-type H+-transporting ATPase subunit c
MVTPELIHYLAIGIALCFSTIGGGIGQGIAGAGVLQVLNRQPTGNKDNFKVVIIGLALIESGIILALVMSMTLIFSDWHPLSFGVSYSVLGIGIAIGFSAAAASISSSFVVKAASEAISRQPFFAQKIITIMLLSQSIIETSIIFTFIIALIIHANIQSSLSSTEGLKFFASAITMALGSLGPAIGQSIFSHASCKSIGINKNAYNKIFPFSLLSQAIAETPMIFCLLISLIVVYTPLQQGNSFLQNWTLLTASITIGLGAIGSSTGIGFVAAKAVHQIAQEPTNYSIILRTALIAEAFVESAAIYAMIISLLLIMS